MIGSPRPESALNGRLRRSCRNADTRHGPLQLHLGKPEISLCVQRGVDRADSPGGIHQEIEYVDEHAVVTGMFVGVDGIAFAGCGFRCWSLARFCTLYIHLELREPGSRRYIRFDVPGSGALEPQKSGRRSRIRCLEPLPMCPARDRRDNSAPAEQGGEAGTPPDSWMRSQRTHGSDVRLPLMVGYGLTGSRRSPAPRRSARRCAAPYWRDRRHRRSRDRRRRDCLSGWPACTARPLPR